MTIVEYQEGLQKVLDDFLDTMTAAKRNLEEDIASLEAEVKASEEPIDASQMAVLTQMYIVIMTKQMEELFG